MHKLNGSSRIKTFLSRIASTLGTSGPTRPKPRVDRGFTADEDGLKIADPEQEPLKTAFGLHPIFRVEDIDRPQALSEPSTVRGIERRSLFSRLDAAVSADVYLFQRAERYRRYGADTEDCPRPDSSDTLALALTVWAWTRSRVGLEDEGLTAMGKALEWVDEAESSLRGFVYQRSARMLLDQLVGGSWGLDGSQVFARFIFQDIVRELETARSDHKETEGGEKAVTETTLDLGTAFTSLNQWDVGHKLLSIGLERLEAEETPDRMRQLDARSVLARSYLQQGRLTDAELAAAPIDPALLEPRDRYLWLHLQADLHGAVGRRESAYARRLEALASGLDHCGPERILEDLASLGRDRPESAELSGETARWVDVAVGHLESRVKDGAWRAGIEQLGGAVLSGSEPKDGWEPVALQKRLYRALRNELTCRSEEDDRTTEVSDGA